MALVWGLVQTNVVQNWLIRQVTGKLSRELNTTVQIRHVDFSLFNKMSLEGTLVKDRQQDTLLYAGKIHVRITDWFFLKDKIVLQYIGLEDASVFLHREQEPWNYQFLADYFAAPPSDKKNSGINLDLKKITLTNVRLLKKDEWRGEDILVQVKDLDLTARQIDLINKKVFIHTIAIHEPFFSIYDYPGNRPPRSSLPADTTQASDTAISWNPGGWQMLIDRLSIQNGIFKTDKQHERAPYYYFDGQHILFSEINSRMQHITLEKDTLSAAISLSTKERSGLHVRSFGANLKWDPKSMDFRDLDILTNRSHLRDHFKMSYDSFDDMNDFIDKVRMEGNFIDSEIESDDIAFFAPALKNWKKRIALTGTIKGPVSNLSARNMLVKAGKNTSLNGDIRMRGLPDIDKTFIDFTANNFRTNYADAVQIIPELKQLSTPRLDKIQYLNFKGSFTGFVRDFVTYGVIETNLGTIKTDVNMKLPENGIPGYSGNIATRNFDIGEFMAYPPLGKISFSGKVNGKRFQMQDMQFTLDGNVQSIEYNGYTYQGIQVKGTLARRLFNGYFMAADPELNATLNGLIDMTREEPAFNFTANIDKANLKKLNLYKENIDIKGQVDFNFTGSTFDNFLGSARMHHASIYKDGRQLSFDSLSLVSAIEGNIKTIRVSSNEFDGYISGEFSIHELPNAFKTFLNRYYPSYFDPPDRQVTKEDFNFVLNTRNVEEYLELVNKNLKGFNDAHINGRINSKNTTLSVNASLPSFSYKNILFSNLAVTGEGNLDTLQVNTRIGEVTVNDSLRFPGTAITVQSSEDISSINIHTSANKTLNSANIAGQVQLLKDGVRILFSPSSFDINGKEWTIDKDGELILSKELITSNGLSIYNDQQEIYISTHPSPVSNTNDIKISLKKINIGDFAPFFIKGTRLEGLLSGNIEIKDPFGYLSVDAIAEAEQFRLNNDSIGKLSLHPNYSKASGMVSFNVLSDNRDYDFSLEGLYDLSDSSDRQLDIATHLTNVHIGVLENYIGHLFSRMKGNASGDFRITGPVTNLKYLGNIELVDGGLQVDYTRCYYRIPRASFQFRDGYIDFGSFTVKDTLNNSGTITAGRLYHENFSDLAFDFNLRTNQLLLLNTGPADNNQFYGTLIGKANISLKGPLRNMQMTLKGEPTDTSNLYLPISTGRESGDADFIVWKVYGKEMQPVTSNNESNLHVSLDINANKYANVYVILDELTGDIIKAKGTGNIQLNVGTNENLTMEGRFEIDEGEYNFSFQSIKRHFRLRQGTGNFISWNGDPTNATINIVAEYEAENVRFKDLGVLDSKEGGFYITNKEILNYRGKVIVVATLKDKLTRPDISFQIELPANSPLKSDQEAYNLFQLIQRDPNELNKQVSFLIVFNTFGPLTSNRGSSANIANAAFEGILVNSISGFISKALTNEFSNILRNVFKDESLQVNINASLYNGTNLVDNLSNTQLLLPDRTNFNLSIAKSYFDERLTFVVGSALDFGLNPSQQSQSSFQFLPDVTAEWKLSPDGKFRLSFFYRDSYSYISGRPRNRSGASISYRKEFDRLDELLKRKKDSTRLPEARPTR